MQAQFITQRRRYASKVACGVLHLSALLGALLATHAALAQSPTSTPALRMPQVEQQQLDYGLQVSSLPGGWRVIAGANDDFSPQNGCNIINTVFIADGPSAVVINTGVSLRYGQQQRALVERSTGLPVREVWALNLHPDYFFGNQAFKGATLKATALTIEGSKREGAAYADNLYRLCGEWMKGTESTPPDTSTAAADFRLSGRAIEVLELNGHTDSDLVIFDRTHRVLIAGGLVFNQRVPTMPHAKLKNWMDSLVRLLELPIDVVVPSHGPVASGKQAILDTLDYLRWFDDRLVTSARKGLEMNEVLRLPIPDRFAKWAAMPDEYARNVTTLYPAYEDNMLR